MNRREFLRNAAVAGTAILAGCAPTWDADLSHITPDQEPKPAHDRFAVAMWDFSWATRRSGNEAEYADWDTVLDELADRGYDTVRIDAFPQLVAAGRNGKTLQEAVVLPQRPRFMWGNHAPVRIDPRRDLLSFLGKCRARGIFVGLSTWLTPDAAARHLEVETPGDFARIWAETLALVESAGYLDIVRWVDLCNEFPLDMWTPGAARRIYGAASPSIFTGVLRAGPWPNAWGARTQTYLTEAIRPLRERWPGIRFCFSFSELTGAHVRALDVSAFGVAEAHCWISDNPWWMIRSGQWLPLFELPGGAEIHARLVADTPRATLQTWADEILEPEMRVLAHWAQAKSLPLITTEGWGPINYADTAGRDDTWRWLRDFSELAVEKAIRLGWTGICSSNFCQPHHTGMWADPAWHRGLTGAIKAESGAVAVGMALAR